LGAVLVAVAFVGQGFAAPGGIPGAPDEPGGGEPPVAGVVRPMTNGDLRSSRPQQKTNNLKYGGGGVQVDTKVYLVFWGSQWSETDPVATYLQEFLGGLWGAADSWSTSTTQYCQGTASGSTTCAAGSTPIRHPVASPLVATWFDKANGAAPSGASQSQLAAEARRAAAQFSPSAPLGPNAQIVVVTPHGASPQGFGTSYCAWHSYTTSAAVGMIAYTNLPYIPDAGGACGQGFVNGASGALDGVSIVEGHEYAETVTDPFLNAWKDQQGAENADKCAWVNSGQGAASNLTLGGKPYAVQSLWSNTFNGGAGGCVMTYP
jgi:serine protease